MAQQQCFYTTADELHETWRIVEELFDNEFYAEAAQLLDSIVTSQLLAESASTSSSVWSGYFQKKTKKANDGGDDDYAGQSFTSDVNPVIQRLKDNICTRLRLADISINFIPLIPTTTTSTNTALVNYADLHRRILLPLTAFTSRSSNLQKFVMPLHQQCQLHFFLAAALRLKATGTSSGSSSSSSSGALVNGLHQAMVQLDSVAPILRACADSLATATAGTAASPQENKVKEEEEEKAEEQQQEEEPPKKQTRMQTRKQRAMEDAKMQLATAAAASTNSATLKKQAQEDAEDDDADDGDDEARCIKLVTPAKLLLWESSYILERARCLYALLSHTQFTATVASSAVHGHSIQDLDAVALRAHQTLIPNLLGTLLSPRQPTSTSPSYSSSSCVERFFVLEVVRTLECLVPLCVCLVVCRLVTGDFAMAKRVLVQCRGLFTADKGNAVWATLTAKYGDVFQRLCDQFCCELDLLQRIVALCSGVPGSSGDDDKQPKQAATATKEEECDNNGRAKKENKKESAIVIGDGTQTSEEEILIVSRQNALDKRRNPDLDRLQREWNDDTAHSLPWISSQGRQCLLVFIDLFFASIHSKQSAAVESFNTLIRLTEENMRRMTNISGGGGGGGSAGNTSADATCLVTDTQELTQQTVMTSSNTANTNVSADRFGGLTHSGPEVKLMIGLKLLSYTQLVALDLLALNLPAAVSKLHPLCLYATLFYRHTWHYRRHIHLYIAALAMLLRRYDACEDHLDAVSCVMEPIGDAAVTSSFSSPSSAFPGDQNAATATALYLDAFLAAIGTSSSSSSLSTNTQKRGRCENWEGRDENNTVKEEDESIARCDSSTTALLLGTGSERTTISNNNPQQAPTTTLRGNYQNIQLQQMILDHDAVVASVLLRANLLYAQRGKSMAAQHAFDVLMAKLTASGLFYPTTPSSTSSATSASHVLSPAPKLMWSVLRGAQLLGEGDYLNASTLLKHATELAQRANSHWTVQSSPIGAQLLRLYAVAQSQSGMTSVSDNAIATATQLAAKTHDELATYHCVTFMLSRFVVVTKEDERKKSELSKTAFAASEYFQAQIATVNKMPELSFVLSFLPGRCEEYDNWRARCIKETASARR